ncbi:hypothetical protein P9112_009942 [Eukaryota sp. TZLM1-RC]
MIDAYCARHHGGVTCEPLDSSLKNSPDANSEKITGPASTKNPEPFISLTTKELNKPIDKKLLHLKIHVDSKTVLNEMVDTGATVSCINRDLKRVFLSIKPTKIQKHVDYTDTRNQIFLDRYQLQTVKN